MTDTIIIRSHEGEVTAFLTTSHAVLATTYSNGARDILIAGYAARGHRVYDKDRDQFVAGDVGELDGGHLTANDLYGLLSGDL